MFLGHEQCKISVKYVMCSSLEPYLSASGQNYFVSQTKTLSSFHRFNKCIFFINKIRCDTNLSSELHLSLTYKGTQTEENNQGTFWHVRHPRCDLMTMKAIPHKQTRKVRFVLLYKSLNILFFCLWVVWLSKSSAGTSWNKVQLGFKIFCCSLQLSARQLLCEVFKTWRIFSGYILKTKTIFFLQ